MNPEERDMEITLPLLQALDENRNISQRTLAKRLGVALGLTNAFIKHCVRKGLIKIEQIPANRYVYYLTPKGFAEKSRLTAQYLSNSFKFYRTASNACRECFELCQQNGWQTVYLCGVSELAEIAVLQALHSGIVISGIYDPQFQDSSYLDRPIISCSSQLDKEAVFILTTVDKSYQQQLQKIVDHSRILQPNLFG